MSNLGASIAKKAVIAATTSIANNVKRDIVLKMLRNSRYTLDDIIYVTDFSKEQIAEIKKEITEQQL